MDTDQPIPYMKLTIDRQPTLRVKRGMNLEEVREIWRIRANAETAEIMNKYKEQNGGRSGGREGLGIYGQFQSRASRARYRLAEQLLKSAGFPVDEATIRKVMNRKQA